MARPPSVLTSPEIKDRIIALRSEGTPVDEIVSQINADLVSLGHAAVQKRTFEKYLREWGAVLAPPSASPDIIEYIRLLYFVEGLSDTAIVIALTRLKRVTFTPRQI